MFLLLKEQSPSIDCLRLQEMNGDQNESVETKGEGSGYF